MNIHNNTSAVIHNLLTMACVLLLTSCATVQQLDTLNKRMGAFEIAYGETLQIIDRWLTQGMIDDGNKATLQKHIKKIQSARQAFYVAKKVNDFNKAKDSLDIATKSLELMREFIKLKTEQTQGKLHTLNPVVNL